MPTLPHVLLVTGPPFGASFFRAVRARLGDAEAVELCDAAAPHDGWHERGAALARRLAERPTVLVAHGLAVPAAVHAALLVQPQALVLVNGPITRVDPVTRGLARAAALSPGVAATTWLRPAPFLRWLRSSLGLRRAVVNPYVMDRDTVVALCGPPLRSTASRRAVASYLRSLAGDLPDPRSLSCPVVLAWGDDDPLYPMSEADFLVSSNARASCRTVPGGRFGHPEERAWALADMVAAVCRQTSIAA
jgi:hypothetical protein